jgi:hypothetical protein
MLVRRVVPAMAATLAAWARLALATAVYLRQHYQAPLITSNPNLTGLDHPPPPHRQGLRVTPISG